jgi:hypothetical protein
MENNQPSQQECPSETITTSKAPKIIATFYGHSFGSRRLEIVNNYDEKSYMYILENGNIHLEADNQTLCYLHPLFDFTSWRSIVQSLHLYHSDYMKEHDVPLKKYEQPKQASKESPVCTKLSLSETHH